MYNIGATHTNNDEKVSVTVRWTAPVVDTGPIVFRCSIIQGYVDNDRYC